MFSGLKDAVAIISGAGGGMGTAAALRLARVRIFYLIKILALFFLHAFLPVYADFPYISQFLQFCV